MTAAAGTLALQAPRGPARDGAQPNRAGRDGYLSALGWQASPELPYREWVTEGRRIGLIWRGSPWWIGDWLLYGTNRWGEMYSQAAKITGYDRKSLRNMRYVSSRFQLSLRKDNLTWSHHALLASLEPEMQRHWLDRATDERLSVEDLRVELRAAKQGSCPRAGAQGPPESARSALVIACPNCGDPVPVPLKLVSEIRTTGPNGLVQAV